MTQAFVLDDGRMTDRLVLVEDAVGKHLPLPADHQPAIGEVVQINILASKLL